MTRPFARAQRGRAGLMLIASWGLVGSALWVAGLWLPRLLPWMPGMDRHESRHFVVWALPAQKRAALELRSLLEDRAGACLEFLDVPAFPLGRQEFLVYPDRLAFNLHRAGYWAVWRDEPALAHAWAGGRGLVVDPARAGYLHPASAVLGGLVESWMRERIRQEYPGAALWLVEGLAAYLAGQSREGEDPGGAPPVGLLTVKERQTFLAAGGDRLADSFVAWLLSVRPKSFLLELLAEGDAWTQRLPGGLAASYTAWLRWLGSGRAGDPRLGLALPALL